MVLASRKDSWTRKAPETVHNVMAATRSAMFVFGRVCKTQHPAPSMDRVAGG